MSYSQRRDTVELDDFSGIGDVNTVEGAKELVRRATAHLAAVKAIEVRQKVDEMFQQQQDRPGPQRNDPFSL